MNGGPFDGLNIPPGEALAALARGVESLDRIVHAASGTARAPADVLDAKAALCYFAVENDLAPDSGPGGLVDDLALIVATVLRLDPGALAGWPHDPAALRAKLPSAQQSALLFEKLRRMAFCVDPVRLSGECKRKLQDVAQRMGLPVPAAASSPHPAPAAGRETSPGPGAAGAGAGPTIEDARQGLRLYMTLVAGAMAVSKPPLGASRQRRAPRRAAPQETTPAQSAQQQARELEDLLRRFGQIGG